MSAFLLRYGSTPPGNNSTGFDGILQVKNGVFTNGAGAPQTLVGMNNSGMEGSYSLGADQGAVNPTSGAWSFGGWNADGTITGGFPNVAYLKSVGCNFLRIPINVASLLGFQKCFTMSSNTVSSGTFNLDPCGTYKAQLVNFVNQCVAAKIYTVLSFHCFAPDMIVAGINGGLQFHVCPNKDQSSFFNSDNYELGLRAACALFNGNRSVGYDLCNEPELSARADQTQTAWNAWLNGCNMTFFPVQGHLINYNFTAFGMQRAVDIVRSTGSLNTVFCGGVAFACELGVGNIGNSATGTGFIANKPIDPTGNLAASVHIYPNTDTTNGGFAFSSDPANGYASSFATKNDVRNTIKAVINSGTPVLIGEMGGQSSTGTPNEPFISTVLTFATTQIGTKKGSLAVTGWGGSPYTPQQGTSNQIIIYQNPTTLQFTDGYGKVFGQFLSTIPH